MQESEYESGVHEVDVRAFAKRFFHAVRKVPKGISRVFHGDCKRWSYSRNDYSNIHIFVLDSAKDSGFGLIRLARSIFQLIDCVGLLHTGKRRPRTDPLWWKAALQDKPCCTILRERLDMLAGLDLLLSTEFLDSRLQCGDFLDFCHRCNRQVSRKPAESANIAHSVALRPSLALRTSRSTTSRAWSARASRR